MKIYLSRAKILYKSRKQSKSSVQRITFAMHWTEITQCNLISLSSLLIVARTQHHYYKSFQSKERSAAACEYKTVVWERQRNARLIT